MFLRLVLISILSLASLATQAQSLNIAVSDNNELAVEQHPAKGNLLMLWIAPEYGFRDNHHTLAKLLPAQGIEVWQVDMLESLFLPHSSDSMRALDSRFIADLIEQAHQQSGKKIILAADTYAALAALSGARLWQTQATKKAKLIGAVLFSPFTYADVPPLGQEPQFMPIVHANNIPLIIYQGKNSATTGQFPVLLDLLQQHGAAVYTQITPGVMSFFYEREPTEAMQQRLKKLPAHLKRMISLLQQHPLPDQAAPLPAQQKAEGGIDIALKPYRGSIKPLPINLPDSHGKQFHKASYKGKVTVVNFWATWCPPCVEEIPSLNRLKEKMQGENFELISINYAEDAQTIREFMQLVQVDFPVLLDNEGLFAQQWKVIAFPSTFVIGPDGQIRYGVNAGIVWDEANIIKLLKKL